MTFGWQPSESVEVKPLMLLSFYEFLLVIVPATVTTFKSSELLVVSMSLPSSAVALVN